MHFDCVNGFLNSIKEIIWQTEAIYRCPLKIGRGFEAEQHTSIQTKSEYPLGFFHNSSDINSVYT